MVVVDDEEEEDTASKPAARRRATHGGVGYGGNGRRISLLLALLQWISRALARSPGGPELMNAKAIGRASAPEIADSGMRSKGMTVQSVGAVGALAIADRTR